MINRTTLVALGVALVISTTAAAIGDPPPMASLRTFARTAVSGPSDTTTGRTGIVIRDPDHLQRVLGMERAAAALERMNVSAVDWGQQMLVYVSAGTQPSGGHGVEITSLTLDTQTGKVTVDWTLHAPTGYATLGQTTPAELVLTARTEGEVEFLGMGGDRQPSLMTDRYSSLGTMVQSGRTSGVVEPTLPTPSVGSPDPTTVTPWLVYRRSGGFTGWVLDLTVTEDGTATASEGGKAPEPVALTPLAADDLGSLRQLVAAALALPKRTQDPEKMYLRDGMRRTVEVSQADGVHVLDLSDNMLLQAGDIDLYQMLEGLSRRK